MSEMASHPRRQAVRKIIIDLGIMTMIGIFLAVIGPFGSISQPLTVRLISWLGFAYLGYAIYSPMGIIVRKMASAFDLPEAPLWVFAVAIATIPMTAAVWAIGFIPRSVPMPTLDQALTSYFYVFVVGGAVTAFFFFIESKGQTATQPAPVAEPVAPLVSEPEAVEEKEQKPRFLERIPAHLGEDLLALEMEDHYVRVHTALGSDLVLMRMRDAVAELEGIEGAQVHRSWWVAREAVTGTTKDGRNLRFVLSGGLEAPVSRTNAPVLKQAGWY